MDKAATIKSRIVEAVIQDIIDGRYSSNDIITEKELIERFNVSKSPVRDALVELCANEVLKNIPRYGYQIVHIGREKMHEMMEFRFILESYCLRKSIRYVTPQNIERLEQLQEHGVHPHERHARYPCWRLVRLPVADHGGMERRDTVRRGDTVGLHPDLLVGREGTPANGMDVPEADDGYGRFRRGVLIRSEPVSPERSS